MPWHRPLWNSWCRYFQIFCVRLIRFLWVVISVSCLQSINLVSLLLAWLGRKAPEFQAVKILVFCNSSLCMHRFCFILWFTFFLSLLSVVCWNLTKFLCTSYLSADSGLLIQKSLFELRRILCVGFLCTCLQWPWVHQAEPGRWDFNPGLSVEWRDSIHFSCHSLPVCIARKPEAEAQVENWTQSLLFQMSNPNSWDFEEVWTQGLTGKK